MWLKRAYHQWTSKPKVNQLPLPPLLIELMNTGRWGQPTDERIQVAIPFLREPVNFLLQVEVIRSASDGATADHEYFSGFLREYRSSRDGERDLHWLDADNALFIAVNRHIGDDLGIALDYRTSMENPRVVASNWWTEDRGCYWQQVDAHFSDFVERLGL